MAGAKHREAGAGERDVRVRAIGAGGAEAGQVGCEDPVMGASRSAVGTM